MRTYHVQSRDDYVKYNKICGQIRQLGHKLSQLHANDPVRLRHEEQLLEKLTNMGVLFNGGAKPKISDLENKITVAAFCRRRLPVVMCQTKDGVVSIRGYKVCGAGPCKSRTSSNY